MPVDNTIIPIMLAYGSPMRSKTFEEALEEIKKKKQEKVLEKNETNSETDSLN